VNGDPFDDSEQHPASFVESQSEPRSFASTTGDVNKIDSTIWIKILVGAIAAPVVVAVGGMRAIARGADNDIGLTPFVAILVLMGSSIIGASLGALLALKDRVDKQVLAGHSVSTPLRLLFGYGLWSLLAVWFPLVIVGTLVITTLILTIRI
jgi:hypothetical protein